MSKVGKSEIRVDAFDKVTGRTTYYEDRMRENMQTLLVALTPAEGE